MADWESSELARTVCVRHFLYFDSEAAAKAAAAKLEDDGCVVEWAHSAADESWLVVVTDPILTDDAITELTAVATALGGRYDGWETELDPGPDDDD